MLPPCRQAGMGLPEYGLDLDQSNPDFVALAEAYGAKGHRVTGPDQLGSVLQHCLSTPGCVHVVEVPVDYASSSHLQARCAPAAAHRVPSGAGARITRYQTSCRGTKTCCATRGANVPRLAP